MPSRSITPDTFARLSPELLAQARADSKRTWSARGLCVGADPAVFFPPGDGPAAAARRMCAACPVRDQCLAYAVTADERFGIWGGLDRHERHSLRRHLQRCGMLPLSGTGTAV